MKKTYTKPEISFESFLMSTNVASTCEEIIDNQGRGVCALLGSGGVQVFTDKILNCLDYPADFGEPEDQYNGFCYHVPVDDSNLFNS